METHTVLREYFNRKKKSTRGYSLSKLAQDLDLSVSFVSRMLSGQKPVPYKTLLAMKKALNIDNEIFQALKRAHSVDVGSDEIPKAGKAQYTSELNSWNLTADSQFKLLRQWFYPAILQIVLLKDQDISAAGIADRLGLAVGAVEVALGELTSAGYLKRTADGYSQDQHKIRLSHDSSVSEIRRFHKQMLEMAILELKKEKIEDFDRRLITGIILTASAEKIQKAKAKLAECLHEIANELTNDEGTDVYHLGGCFFPLTKPIKSRS